MILDNAERAWLRHLLTFWLDAGAWGDPAKSLAESILAKLTAAGAYQDDSEFRRLKAADIAQGKRIAELMSRVAELEDINELILASDPGDLAEAWRDGFVNGAVNNQTMKSTEWKTQRDTLRAEVETLRRELERWRHGDTIEGDFVCPDSLALTETRRLLGEALEAWESWVNTEGQYPHGESPECARIAAIRVEAGLEVM